MDKRLVIENRITITTCEHEHMIFKRPKRRMNSHFYLFGILLAGFVVYSLFRDRLFDSFEMEPFQNNLQSSTFASIPAPAPIQIRQAPVYPERDISSSGPSPPAQAYSSEEVTVYGPPQATDPYDEQQESSAIPENLRHPERAYRPAPSQHHTSIAVQSGIASHHTDSSSGSSMDPEMINNGGEFMSGVYANDNFDDAAFSSF